MKRHLLFLILVISNIWSMGQNVTLDELISMRSKTLAEVEEILTAKNWQLMEAQEPTETSLGILSFAFEKVTMMIKPHHSFVFIMGNTHRIII